MLTIEEIKEYARIDADEPVIQTMMSSASSFLKSRGIDVNLLKDPEDIASYKLGMMMLISHYYENRGVMTEKNLKKIPLGIKSIVFDLSMKCKRERAGV